MTKSLKNDLKEYSKSEFTKKKVHKKNSKKETLFKKVLKEVSFFKKVCLPEKKILKKVNLFKKSGRRVNFFIILFIPWLMKLYTTPPFILTLGAHPPWLGYSEHKVAVPFSCHLFQGLSLHWPVQGLLLVSPPDIWSLRTYMQ